MQSSARNLLKGRVKQVTPGAGHAEVTIALPGGTDIVAMITQRAAARLRASQGQEVYAIIKVSDVIVATESPGPQVV
jgi:molybdate transport system regulatory protein